MERLIHGGAYFRNFMVCRCSKDYNYNYNYNLQSGQILGHVPIEISKIMCKFIRDCGEVEVECIGHRYNVGQGKGLEIPVDYRLLGNQQYLQRVVTKLKSIDLALTISDIRKCGTEY